jgi:glycosyltransferase involved in cell wall biosynthesis
MNENVKISCYCCTYGRPRVLEEAVYSFLNQNYSNKELIILNDCKEQKLIFEHPQVKIFNFNERITPLGTKFNVAVNFCSGEIIMPWEDDDIYLPWRMEVTMKNMENGIFHTNSAFYEKNYKELEISKNLFHCNLAIEKNKFLNVGGYPDKNYGAVDNDLFNKLTEKNNCFSKEIPIEDLFYIYRWGTTGSYHGSGIAPYEEKNIEEITENAVKSKDFETGEIKLNPRWKYDYAKTSQDLIKKIKCN